VNYFKFKKNKLYLKIIFLFSFSIISFQIINDIYVFNNSENSKIIKTIKPIIKRILGKEDPCYKQLGVINSAWHCIVKEVIPANTYLYDYYSKDKSIFKLPGGYIDFYNNQKIIGTNGKGEMFIYDIKEKTFIKQKSNLNNIYQKQNFRDLLPSNLLGRFGVKDIFYDKSTMDLYASINVDVTGKGCYGMAIYKSTINFDKDKNVFNDLVFKEFFKTNICNKKFNGHASGGRINKLDNNIIFTVGSLDFEENYQSEEERYYPQKLTNSIGKVISIDPSGKYKILSLGHRNQQGLLVYRDKIFITEHGPQGGDEVNIIEENNHYGWPFYSYGLNYGGTLKYRFPHAKKYIKPHYYFTPSIAISEIIFYDGDEFPHWKNKFIVTSLKDKSLFLMDYDFIGNKFISAERINIGHRIRDIKLSSVGEIFIITDDQNLLRLKRHENDFTREEEQHSLPDESQN